MEISINGKKFKFNIVIWGVIIVIVWLLFAHLIGGCCDIRNVKEGFEIAKTLKDKVNETQQKLQDVHEKHKDDEVKVKAPVKKHIIDAKSSDVDTNTTEGFSRFDGGSNAGSNGREDTRRENQKDEDRARDAIKKRFAINKKNNDEDVAEGFGVQSSSWPPSSWTLTNPSSWFVSKQKMASLYQNSKNDTIEGFTGANLNNGQSASYPRNSWVMRSPKSWFVPNLYTGKNGPPRAPQPVPLPKGQLLMFATTKFKPECCPNTYSKSEGCACMTVNQFDYLTERGGNNVPYSDL